MQAKCYDLWHAKVDAEPRWPEETEGKLLELAFKNKLIADPNHHALKALRGEA
jgi:hypothetical protein